jgi:GTPase SAR1 family protein
LDNAGKTTLLSRLVDHVNTCQTQTGKDPLMTEVPETEDLSTNPTVGVDDVTITLENTKYKVIDVSGQDAFRVHWKTLFVSFLEIFICCKVFRNSQI